MFSFESESSLHIRNVDGHVNVELVRNVRKVRHSVVTIHSHRVWRIVPEVEVESLANNEQE